MTIKLKMPELTELRPKITVLGIGGAGGNAVNNMIRAELQGVAFAALNTDAQALSNSKAERKLQLGVTITQGLGAGAEPEIGRAAAEEAIDAIDEALSGIHMAFITAGMGGGTGTGAAPVVARLAKEKDVLTVGVVTKPFQFEGARRARIADAGIEELQKYVDTLIIIPNQNLFRMANEKTTFQEAFRMADDVLYSGVRGITDLMVMPGLINLDFADVRKVMGAMGKAMMGTGEAEGENRAISAAEAAISNPLLDEASMKGAEGVIINITGGADLTLFEVDEAASHIRNQVDPEAEIIVGSAFNEELEGRIRVAVVATGIGESRVRREDAAIPRVVDLWAGDSSEDSRLFLSKDENASVPEAPENQFDIEDAVGERETTAASEPNGFNGSGNGDAGEHLDQRRSDEPLIADAFLPEAASELVDESDGFVTADPFAEAAVEHGSGAEAKIVEAVEPDAGPDGMQETGHSAEDGSPRMTLFEKVLSFGDPKAGGNGLEAAAGSSEADNAGEGAIEDDRMGEDDALEQDSGIGSLTAEDRAVPPAVEDQLEIPAFLRRTTH
ncbi:MAG: cell division protein FtsZ [Sphingomonadales bacterium]